MNQAIENPKDKLITPYNILLVVAFCYDTLFNFLTIAFRRLPVIGFLGDYVMPAFVVILVLLNMFLYKTFRVHTYDLLVTTLVSFVLCVCYLAFPANQQYYNTYNMELVFLKAIPFLFIGSNFPAKKSSIRVLTYASYLAIAVNIAYVFYFMTDRDASGYNMHYAYLMLPHVIFATHGLFNKELKVHIVLRALFFLIGAFFIVSMGTRGPILILLVYLVVQIWRNTMSLAPKKAAAIIVVTIGIAIYVFSAYLELAEELRDFIDEIGLSTRALDIFLEGEYISATSGRDKIYIILWKKLMDAPFGYGVFGEWQFVNYSAHNIYLQVCMWFGLVPGTLLVVLTLFLFSKGYFATQNRIARDVIMLFLVFSVVRSIFGGEFFSEYVFFLIVLSLQCIKNKNIINCLEDADAQVNP